MLSTAMDTAEERAATVHPRVMMIPWITIVPTKHELMSIFSQVKAVRLYVKGEVRVLWLAVVHRLPEARAV